MQERMPGIDEKSQNPATINWTGLSGLKTSFRAAVPAVTENVNLSNLPPCTDEGSAVTNPLDLDSWGVGLESPAAAAAVADPPVSGECVDFDWSGHI